MRIERLPDRESVALSLVPGVIAVPLLAFDLRALAAGLLGLAVVAAAVRYGRRFGVTFGAGLFFVGVLLAGTSGVETHYLLVTMAGAVLTWDAGQYVVGVTDQLGQDADTRRLTLMHVAGMTLVVTVAGTLGMAVFRFSTGGQPLLALVLLLAGVLGLLVALEP
jgi:hypothetical protein